MNNKSINYNFSSYTWEKKEISEILKVVNSGYYSMGKKVNEFENKFAKYTGVKYAVMTNSGSSANLLGVASQFFLKKNKLKRGDEVIVPATGWSTTYAPLTQYGLKLKIVDIDIESLNIDFSLLKKSISKKTKMICAINLSGIPADLHKIRKLSDKHNIILYEDNCEGLGASINNKKTGSFGNFASHSFFFSHHMSTIEGGMITTNSFEVYNILKCLRAHGWSRDLSPKNDLNRINKNDFLEQYKFLLPGYNVRPNEINAAVGLVQLSRIDKMISIRRKNLKLFEKYFSNDKRFFIPKTNFFNSSFAFSLIINNNINKKRSKIFNLLRKSKIDFRMIAGGCFTEHASKNFYDYKIYQNKLPNSLNVHYNGFWIGNSSKDLTKEIENLYKVLKVI